jgi:RNA polymerase sigma-70 factor (ECF subfamily)
MNSPELERMLAEMRPRLHRYCARMTGSAVDGEDVLQEAMAKAVSALSAGAEIDHPERWLFRIAHNASLDHLRARARANVIPLTDDLEPAVEPHVDVAAACFRTFMRLPVLPRCAVILKDVLGHSVEEIAQIADCSAPAAKSALQRGRASLKALIAEGEDVRLPLLSDNERRQLQNYVDLFRSGDFDTIRQMLAADVRLDLVNRLTLQGNEKTSLYFTRYAEATHWRYAFGAVDGRPAMLVYDARGPMQKPAHFALLDWRNGEIAAIRDFLFAPYVMEAADWVQID